MERWLGIFMAASASVVGATYVSALFTIGEPPGAASWESLCRIAWHTQRSIAASLRTSWPRGRRCVQWAGRQEADPAHRNRCATRRTHGDEAMTDIGPQGQARAASDGFELPAHIEVTPGVLQQVGS